MKKELEEAAHEYFKRGQLGFEKAADTEEAFLRGGLWQQERMYSEEEVLTIIRAFDKEFYQGIVEKNGHTNKWFEQFKKKA